MTEDKRFVGFPRQTIPFLRGLASNNRKDWFEPRRGEYEALIVKPALALIRDLGARVAEFAPAIRPDARIGGSLFRIHRDTRFSKDKSPYKTQVGIKFKSILRNGDTEIEGPVYYLDFDAKRLRIGTGVKAFEPPLLVAYRRHLDGQRVLDEIEEQIEKAKKDGCEILGEILKRTPAGAIDHALARKKGLFVLRAESLPDSFHTASFVGHCLREMQRRRGVFEWFEPLIRDCSRMQ